MDQGLFSNNEALEKQVTRLRELAGSLERAQAAVLRADAGQLNIQTLKQHTLCGELRRLGSVPPLLASSHAQPVTSMEVAATPALDPLAEHQQALLSELQDMVKRVQRLNREYAALLRRARRTVDIFCRVLASSDITYVPPTSQAQSAAPDSRG